MSSPDGPRGPHADPDLLAALLLGDEVDDDVRTHAASCATCVAELEALSETLALVGQAGEETFVAPPPSVWEAIAAEIGASTAATPAPTAPAATPVDPETGEPTTGSSPLGETDPTSATVTPLRRFARVPTWLAATAAAVALAAGVGVGAMVASPEEDPAPQAEVLGNAALTTLDESAEERGVAQVRRHDDRVVLHVEASDLGGPDGIREVWLINVDGSRMVSLGLLPAGEAGDFDFPERLLDEGYRIVDISSEPDDGDPTHSGDSLARGEIAT